MPEGAPRILVTVADAAVAARIADDLAPTGCDVAVSGGPSATDAVIVVDASQAGDRGSLGVPMLAVAATAGEVAEAFARGADDVLRVPIADGEARARVQRLRSLRARDLDLEARARDAQVLLELTQTLATRTDSLEILRELVARLASVVRVERCSVVLARDGESVGFVVAANDAPGEPDRPLELHRYPEIRQVLTTRVPLFIDDAPRHPLLEAVRDLVSGTRLPYLALFPIALEHRAFGVLFLRASDDRGPLDARERALCETLANATAVALRNAGEIQRLRDERTEVSRARRQAERRLQALEPYANLFLSSADGMVVFDLEGRPLYANPRMEEITGYDDQDLRHARVQDVVAGGDRRKVARLFEGFKHAEFPRQVDIRIKHKDGRERTVSLSTSAALLGEHAVLITLRDVSDERSIAAELARTKAFLTSLIESSPDAIVASAGDGTVLLLNSAAERILGCRREELAAGTAIASFFREGHFAEYSRRVRAAPEGRIEGARSEVVSCSGEEIPVLLSAATFHADGAGTGLVVIFSDLRERLRIEERLARVQSELGRSEQQTMIAELSGAAAHELNQPLTAIHGHAELLRRRAAEDAPMLRSAEVILREAGRMAEIVRRLGQVSRFETKPYVGGTKIMDLERSSPGSDPPSKP